MTMPSLQLVILEVILSRAFFGGGCVGCILEVTASMRRAVGPDASGFAAVVAAIECKLNVSGWRQSAG
jgi:hypothetical protein